MGRQELNLLLSETRISNTEMRMNMARISDKVDEVLLRTRNHGSIPQDTFTEIKRDLDTIKLQTFDIRSNMNSGFARNTLDNKGDLDQVWNPFEKMKELKELLKEKEEQLKDLQLLRKEERVQLLNQEELFNRLQVTVEQETDRTKEISRNKQLILSIFY